MTTPSLPARDRAPGYALAIFLSSSLLFLIEPIAGKRLLPLLGGSAAVWAACLVFFQVALLLGYYVAHWLVTRTRPRAQGAVYVALLALAAVQLAIATRATPRASAAHPIVSVFWLLTLLIGIPFVALSITSPLLQAWYARLSVAGARPYWLFAVSNAGSLLALLAYPWLVEPVFTLRQQGAALAIGVVVLAGVAAMIALPAWTAADVATRVAAPEATAPAVPAPGETLWRRILWVLLAGCGSLLLAAVTNHLTQNVATIPLLWILPLIAYLLSFVVAFTERWHPRPVVIALGALGLAAAVYRLKQGDLSVPIPRVVATYCGALFALCLFCHSELYRLRPAPARLTSFYFHVAAGGAFGAILVGIAAPLLLPGYYELAIGLFFATTLGLVVTWDSGAFPRSLGIVATGAMLWFVASQIGGDATDRVLQLRNFYGTLHITQYTDADYHAPVRTLYNGIIEHGQQVFRADLVGAPTTYYGRNSGVGLAIDLCCDGRSRRIGVIGLGAGTLAAYGQPGDTIRFYDINPAVEPIARRYFTYLSASKAHVDVVPGDARVSLAEQPPQRYDVLAVDAFTGDAIPVHLITAEALALYRRHLRSGGIVAFHVSNRYLDLGPVVKQLADSAGMRSVFVETDDDTPTDTFGSDWVLVTMDSAFVRRAQITKAASSITIPSRLRLWTDDYNSLLPVLRWKKGAD